MRIFHCRRSSRQICRCRNEEICFEDGLPLTGKKDKAYHGFGVRSIRHIAEKYKGELVVKKKGDRFVSDIMIPVPDEAQH